MSTSSKRTQISDTGTLPYPSRNVQFQEGNSEVIPDFLSPISTPPSSPPPIPVKKEQRTGTGSEGKVEKRVTSIIYDKRSTLQYFGNQNTDQEANENVTLMYSEREIDTLKDIFLFLLNKAPNLLKEMFTIKLLPMDELAETFSTFSLVTNSPLKLMKYFIEDEFEANRNDEGSIMRDNCIASKLIKAYVHKVGQSYLQEVLGDIINQINSERKISFEINPSFTEPEERERNQQFLLNKVNVVLEKLTSKQSIDTMPAGLRVLAGYIAEFANKYAPKSIYPLVGGFIMLRFFNPAILTPEIYGLMPKGKKPSAVLRRNLTLISKILQNLSSGVEFGKKEEFMVPLNGFIQSKKNEIIQYFDSIIVPIDATVVVPSELNVITVKDLHTFHKILFQKQNHFATVISHSNLQGSIFLNKHSVPLGKKHKRGTLGNSFSQQQKTKKKLFPLFFLCFLSFPKYTELLSFIYLLNVNHILEFASLLDKLGSYQSKVSFSFLSSTDRKTVKSILNERNEEASFINWVDKKKRNKVQKRLLIVGMNRIISVKPNGKIAREGHALDLIEVKSTELREIELTFKTFKIVAESDQVDDIVNSIRRAYEFNFSGMPENLKFKLTIQPTSRISRLPPSQEGVCDGFVATYRSLCDYYSVPVSKDLCWDIDNIFSKENQGAFNFSKMTSEFETPLTQADLMPIFYSLRYNTFFTSFIIRDMKLEKQTLFRFAEFLASNSTLTHLTISSIGGPKDNLANLFEAMANNSDCRITHLDVSNTSIEDKGLTALANYLKRTSVAISHLDISSINCTPKGLVTLFAGFQDNPSKYLKYLSVSNNRFSPESCTAFWQYLITNGVTIDELYMSNTTSNFKIILEGLSLKANVRKLDLSNNKLKPEEANPIVDYVQKSGSLEEINLNGTFISNDSLQYILTSFNNDLNVTLSLCNNNLGLSASQMLSKVAYKFNSITVLDLADNDLGDEGIAELFTGLRNNFFMKRLYLNRTIKSGKTKSRSTAIENLIKLISSDCGIEALHLNMSRASPLKTDLIPFIHALGSNTTITELDISGNQMGNKGAIALAKTLQTNHTLSRLFWDENQTGPMGFRNIKHALKMNRTLKYMPLPVLDVAAMLNEISGTSEAERMRSILNKIERGVLNNQING